jgi:hypothetical protein
MTPRRLIGPCTGGEGEGVLAESPACLLLAAWESYMRGEGKYSTFLSYIWSNFRTSLIMVAFVIE